jgi:hypothetical protein
VSAEVLKFPAPTYKGTQKRQMPEGPRFFCSACQVDQFRIYADMRIYCVGCNQHIRLDRGIA